MEIRRAGPADVESLARLLWDFASDQERSRSTTGQFTQELPGWLSRHADTHLPFLLLTPAGEVVGMAWLAVLERVPRPGSPERRCGDLQSVVVRPEHRSHGLGAALVQAVVAAADELGLEHVTVGASARSVGLYERHGFTGTETLLLRPGRRQRRRQQHPATG